jgi:NAD(P)-dependent dehydrogenase (short-subunit alcohol dehydrogenase family)
LIIAVAIRFIGDTDEDSSACPLRSSIKALVERTAMERLGTARDTGNSVVFFASELAGFVNGQVLAVDGGK